MKIFPHLTNFIIHWGTEADDTLEIEGQKTREATTNAARGYQPPGITGLEGKFTVSHILDFSI